MLIRSDRTAISTWAMMVLCFLTFARHQRVVAFTNPLARRSFFLYAKRNNVINLVNDKKNFAPLFLSSATTADGEKTSSSITSADQKNKILTIKDIQSSVVQVLNDSFDPVVVARNKALSQLEPKKKKKKKKKQSTDEDQEGEKDETPTLSEGEKEKILLEAENMALPFSFMDAMVTPATRAEFGDYQCNAAMGLAKHVNMSPRDCATKIAEGLGKIYGDDESILTLEIAGPGFINLKFSEKYLATAIQQMAKDTDDRLSIPKSRYVALYSLIQ